MEYIIFIVVFLAGVVFGVIMLTAWLIRKRIIGNLIIDKTNEDGPYFFLELQKEPANIKKDKYWIVRAKERGYFDS